VDECLNHFEASFFNFKIMSKKLNLVGQRFGRWTVIEFAFRKNQYIYLKCKCDCGNIRNVLIYSLLNKRSKSCGCWKIEERLSRFDHGMCRKINGKNNKNRFYVIYCNIRSRCNGHKDYKGRDIKICDKWLDFKNFRDDMYKSYLKHVEEFGEKNTTIDRMDNDGNYYKKNCRWATQKEQQNNKRNNYSITYKGQTRNIAQWAKELNFHFNILHNRIIRGWTIERALTQRPSHNIQVRRCLH